MTLPTDQRIDLRPDRLDRVLAVVAVALLAIVAVALARGVADWPRVPTIVWAHIATIAIALALTPVMLLRRRGDRPHRLLGWIWVGALALTALLSFDIRVISPGRFSFIHLLSIWTLIQLPLIVWRARQHRHAAHRRAIRGMVIGALLVAGFFTLPPFRMLGHWLFG